MKIKLRLYATLQDYLPPESSNSETIIDLPVAATIPDALAVLAVPMTLPHIVFVNGRHVLRPDLAARQLHEGDVLAAFPAIGGG